MTGVLYQNLVVGALLFALGAFGFLARRNLIVMFLSVELMLQGVMLNLLAFSRYHGDAQGQVFAIMVLTVAACESAIALALVIALYQQRRTLDVALVSELNERTESDPDVDMPPPWSELDEPPLPQAPPRLAPAGPEPDPATVRTQRSRETANRV